jgi:tetratricopeptide (TPR) repeat protein
MSEEFQRMHQDLADIRDSVKDLATRKVEPAPAPLPPAPDTNAKAEALRLKAEAMLARAQKEEAAGNLLEADQLLDGIQILDPDYLPAYEERAQVYERRGLLEKAREQWKEVMNRSPGTPLYERAAAERIRLGQAAREAAQARIISVDAVKLQATEEYDERRILNITLAPSSPDKMLDVSGVRIEVLFYDADRKSGKILRTRAIVPKEPLKLEGRWGAGEHKSAEATYLVPRGFRAREAKEGRETQFYGYLVRIYYHDQLQAQDARPKTLLDARPAAK